jgi:uncharacterized membrane protein (DUF2068 family)
MDWSLLGCGARGHVTFAPDEPALRERFSASVPDGEAWRCLRCGSFVAGPPTAAGPAVAAPRVRRDKELRSALILRVFAVERFLRALLFAGLAIGVWRFLASRLTIEEAYDRELPAVRTLLRQLGLNVQHSRLLGLINSAFTLDPRILAWLAIGAAGYAVIEVIEGTGLWLLRRWGEYFAVVATSVFLPYEIYDLTVKVTALRLVAFLINLALVVYLVVAKRLFGARGGKKAYEAQLRGESILDAEIATLEAGQSGSDAATGPPAREEAATGPPAREEAANPAPPAREEAANPAPPAREEAANPAPSTAPPPPTSTASPDPDMSSFPRAQTGQSGR